MKKLLIAGLLLSFNVNAETSMFRNGDGSPMEYSQHTEVSKRMMKVYIDYDCDNKIDWSGETITYDSEFCYKLKQRIEANMLKKN